MASSLSSEVFDKIVKETLRDKFSNIDRLSTEQYKAIWNYINRKDVFAILPTGHGKSLIFQLIAELCRR
jgi:superfamily II DNA helicase RecQ